METAHGVAPTNGAKAVSFARFGGATQLVTARTITANFAKMHYLSSPWAHR